MSSNTAALEQLAEAIGGEVGLKAEDIEDRRVPCTAVALGTMES